MRMRSFFRNLVALSLLTVVATLLVEAQRLSFEGEWKLDPAKSALWEGGATDIVMSIGEQKRTVTVAVTSDGREHRYACSVDGPACQETTAHGDVYVRRLQRAKSGLTWSVTMTRKADRLSISYTERWTLDESGRTLTVHTTYPGGREVVKVFTRRPETTADASKH